MTEPLLTLSFDVTLADYRVLVSRVCSLKRLPHPAWVRATKLALWVLSFVVLFVFTLRQPSGVDLGLMFAATGIPLALNIVMAVGTAERMQPRADGAVLGHRELVVQTDGIVYTSTQSETFFRWSAFIEVIDAPGHVLLVVDTTAALLVPKRALPSPDALRVLLPVELQTPPMNHG